MLIKSIKIENFQAHESREITLSRTITTLTGPSDVGKSSVLRALRWLCLNDLPGGLPGDAFIREGEKKAIVTISIGENEIKRTKGGSVNNYELDGDEFKSFGQGNVPSKISSLLGLSEINFQGQHDSPFWFAESAGEVSRQLNSVIDLSVIDTALSNISSQVRKATERKELGEERLTKSQVELLVAESNRNRTEEFATLKKLNSTWGKLCNDRDRLNSLTGKIQDLPVKELREKAEEGESVLTLFRYFIKLSRKQANLSEIIEEVSTLHEQAKAPPDFSPLEILLGRWIGLRVQYENLRALHNLIVGAQAQIEMTLRDTKLAEKKFHQRTDGIKCPLCGK